MPTKRDPKKRTWMRNKQMHEREVDNSWFYNDWRWRKFSRAFKDRNPECKDCAAEGVVGPAEVTDHKEQYSKGGKGWDLDKLEDKDFNPMCTRHHNSRSGRQAHGKG